MKYDHSPVLLSECIDGLRIKPEGLYIDGTLGGGGHSVEIAKRLGENGRLIAIDRDERALRRAGDRLLPYLDKVKIVHGNFRDIGTILDGLGVSRADGMLFDLGMSSPQIDEPERGFSYMSNAFLDMRMDETQDLTAYEIVNNWPRDKLKSILREFGQERFAPNISAAIVRERNKGAINTTQELVEIIKRAMPARALREKQHPAKRSFQALRIAVNGELEAISEMMDEAVLRLCPGGRLVVISFHSLEDKIIKDKINAGEKGCVCPRDIPVCACGFVRTLKSITKKPVIPGEAEISGNPRARSAKLRIAEKI